MTRKQYERIRHLEPHFMTAVRSQYKRATTKSEDTEVIETLKELGRSPYTSLSCGRCSYLNFRMLGELYFAYTASKPERKTKKA